MGGGGVRGLNEGNWRRRVPNVVYKGNRAYFLQNEGAGKEQGRSYLRVGGRFW